MLSTAAVPEAVMSTAAHCSRVQRVSCQQAAARLVLQIEELAFAMAQIRLQQAASDSFA